MKVKIIGSTMVVAVIAAVLLYGAWLHFGGFNDEGSDVSMAEVGDSFGVLNSLFSGLAFAGLIITILLQKEELGLQHKEMVKSSAAQERTARLTALSGLLSEYNSILEINDKAVTGLLGRSTGGGGGNIAINTSDARIREKKSKIIRELELVLEEGEKL